MARNPFLPGKRVPLVVGHRGLPHLHQENSLAGFRRAVALGVPAVELDVCLTRDGRAVVCHDGDVERLTGERGNLRDLSWDQVSRLRLRRELPMGVDAAGAPVTVRYAREEPIPLLAEVLDELDGKVAINIELKLDLPRWWETSVGEETALTIAQAGAQGHVIVTSFDPRKLSAARRALPGLAVGFCFDDTMLNWARRFFEPRMALMKVLGTDVVGRLLGTPVVGAEHTLIHRHVVERLHGRGVAIGTHTLFPLGSTTGKPIAPSAATDDEAHRLLASGVDWIETDDAERLMAIVAKSGA